MPEILCACGCGSVLEMFDARGRVRIWRVGHQQKGKPKPEAWKRAMSERMSGSRNHKWNPDRASVGRVGQDFTKKQRSRLLGSRCVKCGSGDRLEMDHVLPIFAGGTNDDSNAQTLCQACNQAKRAQDISRYGKPGELRKHPNPRWMGNSEPSEDGNILEGATVRGRAFRRPGTRLYAIECFCGTCGKRHLVSAWRLRAYPTRPAPKQTFCSDACRLSWLNGKPLAVNSSKSPRPERDDMTWTHGTTVRSGDKKLRDNKIAIPVAQLRRHDHAVRRRAAPERWRRQADGPHQGQDAAGRHERSRYVGDRHVGFDPRVQEGQRLAGLGRCNLDRG